MSNVEYWSCIFSNQLPSVPLGLLFGGRPMSLWLRYAHLAVATSKYDGLLGNRLVFCFELAVEMSLSYFGPRLAIKLEYEARSTQSSFRTVTVLIEMGLDNLAFSEIIK